MNIVIPDSLRPLLQHRATQAGFNTPDEYVLQVLRAELDRGQARSIDALLREAMADGDSAGVTPEDLGRRKSEIETLLLEGLDSGDPVEVNAEFWQARRQALAERIAARKKAGGQ
jgi:antitoxin ParD1/3/4